MVWTALVTVAVFLSQSYGPFFCGFIFSFDLTRNGLVLPGTARQARKAPGYTNSGSPRQ